MRCLKMYIWMESYGRVCPLAGVFVFRYPNTVLSTRFGRNSFQQAAKISGRVDISEIDWPQFKYMVFDEPNHGGTYEQRYAHLGT